MTSPGNPELTIRARVDNKHAPRFTDIQAKPRRPAQYPHDGAIGEPAAIIQRSQPVDVHHAALHDQPRKRQPPTRRRHPTTRGFSYNPAPTLRARWRNNRGDDGRAHHRPPRLTGPLGTGTAHSTW